MSWSKMNLWNEGLSLFTRHYTFHFIEKIANGRAQLCALWIIKRVYMYKLVLAPACFMTACFTQFITGLKFKQVIRTNGIV